jgi:hypothetical protein
LSESFNQRLLAGLSKFSVHYPVGPKSPIYEFQDFEEVWQILLRLGMAEEFQKDLRNDLEFYQTRPKEELRFVKEYTRGGSFDSNDVLVYIILAYFINPPDNVDGNLVLAIPARGAESLVKGIMQKLMTGMMAALSRDATWGVQMNCGNSTPKN